MKLESSRDDELGRLANAFRLRAQEVQPREEALRQVGRAEVATNVLHHVGRSSRAWSG